VTFVVAAASVEMFGPALASIFRVNCCGRKVSDR
jgi:hypothetical protein